MSNSDHCYSRYWDEDCGDENSSAMGETITDSDSIGDFIEIGDELLIACVRNYPHLYNKGEKEYKNNIMRENSWQEIAESCGLSVDVAQLRWKRLRERYGKEIRLNDSAMRSGSAAQKVKQWPLFESMAFLEKHIVRRRTFNNINMPATVNFQLQTSKTDHNSYMYQSSTSGMKHFPMAQTSARTDQSLRALKQVPNLDESMCQETNESWRMPQGQSQTVACQGQSPDYETLSSADGSSSTTANVNSSSRPAHTLKRQTCGSSETGRQNMLTSPSELKNPCETISLNSNFASPSGARRNFPRSPLSEASSDTSTDTGSKIIESYEPKPPKRCFSGGTQRKKLQSRTDPLEASFVNVATAFTEYVRKKADGKENIVSEDECFAKLITSRLSSMTEDKKRGEKEANTRHIIF